MIFQKKIKFRKKILVFASLIICLNSYTQSEFTLSTSKDQKYFSNEKVEFLGTKNDELFVLKSIYNLKGFNQVLYKINSKTLEVIEELDFNKAYPFSNVTAKLMNDKIMLIIEQCGIRRIKYKYYSLVIDASDFDEIQEKELIYECDYVNDVFRVYDIQMHLSENEKFCVATIQDLSSGEDVEIIKHFVFNESAELVYETTLKLDIIKMTENPVGAFFGIGGETVSKYTGIKIVADNGDFVDSHSDGKKVYMSWFSKNEPAPKSFEIKVDEYSIVDFGCIFLENKELLISGSYQNKKNKKTLGFFTKIVTNTNEIATEKKFEYDSSKDLKMLYGGLSSKFLLHKVKEIKQLSDESYFMVFNGVNGAFVVRFDEDGTFEWVKNVPMKFYCELNRKGPQSLGLHLNSENELYLLYNAHSTNYDKNFNSTQKIGIVRCPGASHLLVCTKVNLNNGQTKDYLVSKKSETKLYAMPRYCYSDEENKAFYFYYSNYSLKTKFAKLKF